MRSEDVVVHAQRAGDRHVHVEVLVGAQPAAEQHLGCGGFGLGPGPVGGQQRAIGFGVDRVVRLVVVSGEPRVLPHDHRLVGRVVPLRVEMPELVDSGVGHVEVVVVHHRGALEVAGGQHFDFEIQCAPAEPAIGVVEVAVQRAGVDHRGVRALGAQLVADVEPVGVQPHLDAVVGGHVLQPRGVAVDRQALVGVVEVAVVEGVAHRQPGDVGGGQFLRVGLPLLGGIALDERLVERAADQRDGLLLEVLRVGGFDLGGLLLDQLARRIGGEVLAEELRHQAQAHRELVGLPVVHREHPVLVAGEVGELPHVVPHPLVGGVEQVGAVLVHLDAGLRLRLGVGVAADVRAPLEHEDALVELRRHALGNRQTEESGTDDEEVKTSGHRQPGYPTSASARPESNTGPRSRFAHNSASSL